MQGLASRLAAPTIPARKRRLFLCYNPYSCILSSCIQVNIRIVLESQV
jgi:hypothetical protein